MYVCMYFYIDVCMYEFVRVVNPVSESFIWFTYSSQYNQTSQFSQYSKISQYGQIVQSVGMVFLVQSYYFALVDLVIFI
jgi:hypothetical protein